MAKIFFSICSAHQTPNEECPICKAGLWIDEEEIEDIEIPVPPFEEWE